MKNNTSTSHRGITRFDCPSFHGWRVSITRQWNLFTRYFSDRQYGSEEAAFNAALDLRDRVLAALEESPDDPLGVFERFRKGNSKLEGGAA